MGQIGVITEQGDLGLGFNELNKKDKKAYDNRPNQEKPVREDKDSKKK